jgi:hypothetical protein
MLYHPLQNVADDGLDVRLFSCDDGDDKTPFASTTMNITEASKARPRTHSRDQAVGGFFLSLLVLVVLSSLVAAWQR